MKNTEFNTNVEYQMKNRFIVEFPDEFKIPNYLVKGIDKPKYIPKFPLFDGDLIWSNCIIKFYNPISSINLSSLLYDIKDKMDFEIKIKMLDPVGVVIEETKVFVDRIYKIDFGSLDYDDPNLLELMLELKVKDCIFK